MTTQSIIPTSQTLLEQDLKELFAENTASQYIKNIGFFTRMTMAHSPHNEETEEHLFPLLVLLEKLPALERYLLKT